MKLTSVLRSAAKFNSSFVPRASQSGFSGAVGNTPLIKLNQLSKETGCTIYGKAEYMNPGGSVKDRPALWILENAEKQGLLKPGDTLVEGSAGNTGIGLAQMARARGYKCVIYIPENLAKGKIDMLRLLGVEVHPVPVVPITDPMNFNHQAQRHAERTPNSLWTNQFHNLSNRQAHIETTGPEIWKQTDGKISGFICATGTGGSLAGTTRYLKDISNGKVQCYLADPPGSVLYNYITKGEIERKGTDSFTEGVGQGRVTDNLAADASLLDGAIYVPDEETIAMAYRLLDEEGIFVGTSACLNVVAATKLAKKLGPGNTIVTLLCDAGERYAPRVFSESWLKSRSLYNSIPEHLRKYIVLE